MSGHWNTILHHQVFWKLPCHITIHPSFLFLKQNQKRCGGTMFSTLHAAWDTCVDLPFHWTSKLSDMSFKKLNPPPRVQYVFCGVCCSAPLGTREQPVLGVAVLGVGGQPGGTPLCTTAAGCECRVWVSPCRSLPTALIGCSPWRTLLHPLLARNCSLGSTETILAGVILKGPSARAKELSVPENWKPPGGCCRLYSWLVVYRRHSFS